MKKNVSLLTGEMLAKFYELDKQKKEIELEMKELKDQFHQYFDEVAGPQEKGEVSIGGFKLQRQIRKMEKYHDELTVKKLEEMQLNDLIQVVRKPDDVKIKSALNLGLLLENQLEGCVVTTYSPAITVKPITPR
jgi:hypothetical protein